MELWYSFQIFFFFFLQLLVLSFFYMKIKIFFIKIEIVYVMEIETVHSAVHDIIYEIHIKRVEFLRLL